MHLLYGLKITLKLLSKAERLTAARAETIKLSK